MSTAEDLMDDARSEAAYQEIEREYDDAASTAARGICKRRHSPTFHMAVQDYWTPHSPGSCAATQRIVELLWAAKRPRRPHMANPPIVSMQQMAAFSQRVAERFG